MELVVGTKRWSTWTLRPWLVLKRTGEPFTETLIQLRQQDGQTEAAIRPHSPSGLIPLLKDGDLAIWDSLAICEYLAERFPQAKLWPADPAARALGRAAAAEMHSGFASLRGECPMALEEQPKSVEISDLTQANVRRIVRLWNDLLTRFGGPYLLGEWSIADAYYTPVATRFRTYSIHPSDYGDAGAAGAYAERLLEQPDFLEWERAAQAGI
ncbi:MAG: glutathione S-transferase family protein [Phenylobacterium sp.]|uniref:glutathione S-transferase family protein n=1 Tax=Phenylobacterium sp. TaxID=1871053 RepID=UPI002732B05B|nr:glutathione S-transferase family protein [Phenylobacterium sp.]MDP3174417.1 glutathione S-transferase family protein [Phenylobacterium sp.]